MQRDKTIARADRQRSRFGPDPSTAPLRGCAQVNADAVAFLRDLRAQAGLRDSAYIAGVIGPRRDGYDPADAPDAAEARDYHARQVEILAAQGVDLLYAPTFASRGVAEAIAEIDGACRPAPLYYLIGCIHPTRLSAAFAQEAAALAAVAPRIAGLKANASTLPPDQLDKLDHLDEGSAAAFADGMLALRHDHGFRVLGGCCGTSDKHIRALAAKLTAG